MGRLLLAVAALRLAVVLLAPVTAQEAYYAEYSHHPALSYFDHPPMVAWAIAGGRWIAGDTTLGLRGVHFLLGLATTWIGLLLLRDWRAPLAAARLWVVAALAVPIFAFGETLAMTDGPLLFFWTLALFALWRARGGRTRWWILAGLAAGGAGLSKYTAVFLAPGAILVLLVDRRCRVQWRRPGPWLAAVAGAICLTPVLWWNATHDWASFAFQTRDRYQNARLTAHWVGQLVAGQLAALTPTVAVGLVVAAAWWFRRRRRDPRTLWILAFGLPLPLFMAAQSPWMQVKINWLAPGYVALVLGATIWWTRSGTSSKSRILARTGRAFAAAGVLAFALSPLARWTPWSWYDSWSGWPVIARAAEQHLERLRRSRDSRGAFLFCASYKDAALLAWHLRSLHAGSTPCPPVLSRSVLGGNGRAFDVWDPPRAHLGEDAVAVLRERPFRDSSGRVRLLRRRFREVRLAQRLDVVSMGITVQRATLWICRGYRGPDV